MNGVYCDIDNLILRENRVLHVGLEWIKNWTALWGGLTKYLLHRPFDSIKLKCINYGRFISTDIVHFIN